MSDLIKDTQVFQFIEYLTIEDLQDLVKDIYVMPLGTIEDCIASIHNAKREILEYVTQDYVQLSYWSKTLGNVPPPDTEADDE